MTIQCSRKGDILDVLTERERCNVDPYRTGFGHKNDKRHGTAVRLCFQVLLTKKGAKPIPISPVVSERICERDSLEICDISDTTSPTTGKKKIVIFCSKVSKDDIKVRFYRQNADGIVEWEAWVQKLNTVHRQVVISFETPAYANDNISEPVNVLMQLVKPSDDKRTQPPCHFQYVPDPAANLIRKKKEKFLRSEGLYQYIQQLRGKKRNQAKMEMNIKHNIPPINLDQRSNAGSVGRPPATQSNYIPNLPCHDQAPTNAAVQSAPLQRTHFDNRNFSLNHTVQHSGQNVCNVQCHLGVQPQINYSQLKVQFNVSTYGSWSG